MTQKNWMMLKQWGLELVMCSSNWSIFYSLYYLLCNFMFGIQSEHGTTSMA